MPLSTSVRVYPMKVLLRRSLALATICLMPFVTVTAKEDVKADPVGTKWKVKVTGKDSGSVWGTDHYTLDSKIAKAAVHAGVLKVGEAGVVTVTIKPGQESYTGQARNGVQSSAWGSYAKSYSVSK